MAIYFLLGKRKGLSKRFFVDNSYNSYEAAEGNRSVDQTIIASFSSPDKGEFLPSYLCYRSVMKRNFFFTDRYLKMVGGPDHEVTNPHDSSAAPAHLYWMNRVWAQVLVLLLRGDFSVKQRERLLKISDSLRSEIRKRNKTHSLGEEKKREELLRKVEREKEEIEGYNSLLLETLVRDLSSCPGHYRLLAEFAERPSDMVLQEEILRQHQRLGFSLDGIVLVTRDLPSRDNLPNYAKNRSFKGLIKRFLTGFRNIPLASGLLKVAEPLIVKETLRSCYGFETPQDYDMWKKEEKVVQEEGGRKGRERKRKLEESKNKWVVNGIRFQTLPSTEQRLRDKMGREDPSFEEMINFISGRYRVDTRNNYTRGQIRSAVLELLQREYGIVD